MKTQLIKAQSILGKKVRYYIHHRYSGKRSCCFITVDGTGVIKVTSRCHKKDHYPKRVRNVYRRRTVRTECVNQYEMKYLWNNRKDKVFS